MYSDDTSATELPEPESAGSATPQAVSPGSDGTGRFMEDLIKYISILAFVLYGLGLLVANTDLANYGVTDFGRVKPECIFTGMWSLAFLAMATFPIATWCRVSFHTPKPTKIKRNLQGFLPWIASTLLMSVLAACFAHFFLGVPFDSDSQGFIGEMRSDVPPGWFTLLAIMNFLPIVSILSMPNGTAERDVFRVIGGAFLILSIVGAIAIGYELYPAVDMKVGGGRPVDAVFLFKVEGEDLVTAIQSKLNHAQDSIGKKTVNGDLIYANSDFIIVRIPYCTTQKKVNVITPVIDRKLISAYYVTNFPEPLSIDRLLLCQ
jgi:hypothetical protein